MGMQKEREKLAPPAKYLPTPGTCHLADLPVPGTSTLQDPDWYSGMTVSGGGVPNPPDRHQGGHRNCASPHQLGGVEEQDAGREVRQQYIHHAWEAEV